MTALGNHQPESMTALRSWPSGACRGSRSTDERDLDATRSLWFAGPMDELAIELLPTSPDDAGELLTLQRAAFVTEAQVYGDPHLPALVQTLTDLERELERGIGLKAVWGHRMVGAIRGRIEGHTCHVGRLAVAPDVQGRGIGTHLLEGFEAKLALEVARFELYVGSHSLSHIRLFERFGYHESRREQTSSNVELVFMEKPSPGAASGL